MGLRTAARRVGLVVATVVMATTAVAPATIAPAGAQQVSAVSATSANARFIVETYQRFLGRAPDSAGLDHHLAGLAAGGDRTRLRYLTGLLLSEEGRRRQVASIYDELLGRQPDGAGLAYWADHLGSRGLHDLRILIVASDEYHARSGGTDDAWLEAVYAGALGRAADAAGKQYWLAELSRGAPRILVAAGIHLSGEALGHRAATLFAEALGRTPSGAERAAGAALISARGERALLAVVWSSDELYERYLAEAGAG